MFLFIANNLALDLVNTRIVQNGEWVDLLKGPDDLLRWAAEADLMELQTDGVKNSSIQMERTAVFDEVLEFREMLAKMASDLAHGRAVSKPLLDRINRALRGGSGHFEIRRVGDGYEKRFLAEFDDLSGLLVTVAESAADLLCFGDLAYVKKCENEQCVLYFHDISKNHRRRWCSMSGCGNRAKANAFYQRKRSSVPRNDEKA